VCQAATLPPRRRVLAFETFDGLDGERLAVAICARRTINRDFELRARRRERPQFRSACHRHFPLLQSSSASRRRGRVLALETGETVKARRQPIVVITSNNEKEQPDAFLRRCFFHYIRFPDADTMRAIIDVHFPGISSGWCRRRSSCFTKSATCRG